MDSLRMATWNLDWWDKTTPPSTTASYLLGCGVEAIAIQEVTSADSMALRAAWEGTSLFSQEVYGPATWRWMGSGLLLGARLEVVEAGVVNGLPKPQRSLWARVRTPEGATVTFVSWHAPNAAGDGRETKMAAYRAMSSWFQDLGRGGSSIVLGADLNTWEDPADLQAADPGDPFFDEHEFLGPSPRHGLTDAYRLVMERTGDLDRRRLDPTPGPLAVSYVLSDGTPHRFDRIFVSTDVQPVDAGYDYAGATQAGSDHALHWVDLTVRRTPPEADDD